MITYNITANVNLEVADSWLIWMKEIHIPSIMKTDLFVSADINRIISNSDTGITYAIAYKCRSLKDLQKYEITFASTLRDEYNLLYADSAPTFRTIMKLVEEF
jgi:hypothetical protein|tara:strand:- start:99 stop:407 length:309 start_codon:yes stop_codon:yes gene_type:complete